MTPDELITKKDLEQFKQELFAMLQPFKDAQAPVSQKWLKNEDVKKMLQVFGGTVQNLRVNGSLPFTKVGGLYYYKLEDVEKMLAGPEKKTHRNDRPCAKTNLQRKFLSQVTQNKRQG